jgi:hypothetical protein
MFRSLKDLLKDFLIDNNIYFEVSGGAALWHFEILTDSNGAAMINNFLDAHIITEA